jgi:DNA-binding NarL/FixJ family response regulator
VKLDLIRVVALVRTQILRDGLSALIRSQPDMELVGTAATADSALQLFLALSPEVTLIDVDLPERSGIAAIRGLVAANPAVCVIGLLMDEWDEAGRAALMAGAWSCVCKDRLTADLPAVIRRGCGMTP